MTRTWLITVWYENICVELLDIYLRGSIFTGTQIFLNGSEYFVSKTVRFALASKLRHQKMGCSNWKQITFFYCLQMNWLFSLLASCCDKLLVLLFSNFFDITQWKKEKRTDGPTHRIVLILVLHRKSWRMSFDKLPISMPMIGEVPQHTGFPLAHKDLWLAYPICIFQAIYSSQVYLFLFFNGCSEGNRSRLTRGSFTSYPCGKRRKIIIFPSERIVWNEKIISSFHFHD